MFKISHTSVLLSFVWGVMLALPLSVAGKSSMDGTGVSHAGVRQIFPDHKKIQLASALQPRQQQDAQQETDSENKDNTNQDASPSPRISGEIFGSRGGWFHPFFYIDEEYNDNILNTSESKQSDIITTISPGLWLAFPRMKVAPEQAQTMSRMPGGLTLPKYRNEDFRSLQLALLYGSDFDFFSSHSEQNMSRHRAEGTMQYNLRNGFSLDFLDQYRIDRDEPGTRLTQDIDEYASNLVKFGLAYELWKRLTARFDYSHFKVNYEKKRNDGLNRNDNTIAANLIFEYSPKTSIFMLYRLTDIDYDTSSYDNSQEHEGGIGALWKFTAKSTGRVRLGYGDKNFESPLRQDGQHFLMEMQADHAFTEKTSISINGYRKTAETTITGADYILTNQLGLTYRQRFFTKLSGRITFAWLRDTYEGVIDYDGLLSEKQENRFSFSPAIDYQFGKWLRSEFVYQYNERDSTFFDRDYVANRTWLKFGIAL